MVLVANLPGLCTLIPDLAAGPPDTSFDVLQHGIWVLRNIMDYVTFETNGNFFWTSAV